MRTLIIFLCSIFTCCGALSAAERGRHIPGDKLQIGLGILTVPGAYTNPQISVAGVSQEGYGIYGSVGTQLLPGNAEAVSLKHYSLEGALQIRLWPGNYFLLGYRYAASYPSALGGAKPDKYLWGMYYGLRCLAMRNILLKEDGVALQVSYWPTTSKSLVSSQADEWQYSSRHLITLALSYNIEL